MIACGIIKIHAFFRFHCIEVAASDFCVCSFVAVFLLIFLFSFFHGHAHYTCVLVVAAVPNAMHI